MSETKACADYKELSELAVKEILGSISELQKSGKVYVFLAGGRTPKIAYEMLGKEMQSRELDVEFIPGDDRKDRSNLQMIQDTLGREWKDSWIYGLTQEKASEAYGSGNYIVVLGLGTDLHTASITPAYADEFEDRLDRELVVDVPAEYVGTEPRIDRSTITYRVIKGAKKVYMLVSGKSKVLPLAEALKGKGPAGRVLSENDVLILADKDALGQ